MQRMDTALMRRTRSSPAGMAHLIILVMFAAFLTWTSISTSGVLCTEFLFPLRVYTGLFIWSIIFNVLLLCGMRLSTLQKMLAPVNFFMMLIVLYIIYILISKHAEASSCSLYYILLGTLIFHIVSVYVFVRIMQQELLKGTAQAREPSVSAEALLSESGM